MLRVKLYSTIVLLTILLTSCSSEDVSQELHKEQIEIQGMEQQESEERFKEKKEQYEAFHQEFIGYTLDFTQLEENLLLTRDFILENPDDPRSLEYQLACLDQMITLITGFSQLSPPEELSNTYGLFQSTCALTINAVRACQESLTEEISLEDLADIPDYQDIVMDYVTKYEKFATHLISFYQTLEEEMGLYL